VLCGAHDLIVRPTLSEKLKEHLDCQYMMFDAGHMLIMEEREKINETLLNHFLNAMKSTPCPV